MVGSQEVGVVQVAVCARYTYVEGLILVLTTRHPPFTALMICTQWQSTDGRLAALWVNHKVDMRPAKRWIGWVRSAAATQRKAAGRAQSATCLRAGLTWYQPLPAGRSTACHAVDNEGAPH